jgi:hypothetical protein
MVPVEESVVARLEEKVPDVLRVPPLKVKDPEDSPRLLSDVIDKVPAVRVVPPEYVFTPDKIRVPLPFLVRAPLEVAMIPLTVVLPAPANIRLYVPLIAFVLLSVKVPSVDPIVVLAPSVIAPL